MNATKILWGQVFLVSFVVLAFVIAVSLLFVRLLKQQRLEAATA